MALNGFDYKLMWSDFNPIPARPSGETEDAQIHPEMSFRNWKYTSKGRGVIIVDVDIDLKLVSSDCWVIITAETSDYLLKHEQGHYDIHALVARELYKGFLDIPSTPMDKLQGKVNSVHAKFDKKLKIVDGRYDGRTDHSRNEAVQRIWNQRIATEKQKAEGRIDNLPQ